MFFSIITCTYNPDLGIFKRLVKAINNLNKNKDNNFEWIIVDNNSTIPIIQISFIKDALEQNKNYKIVNETTPGLTSARIKGVKESKYDWIVFFDDDNEPDKDYLIEAGEVITGNGQVACWGPGIIKVVFHGKNNWITKYKHIYQERSVKGIKTYREKKWMAGYPQGTGQIIKKELFFDYINKVTEGIYSMSDRQGRSLSSGGDVQIVLNVIKEGFKVGTSGNLLLKHHIDKSKGNFRYLFKLIYGMASSAILSQIQVFPENKKKILVTNRIVIKTIFLYFRQFKLKAFSKANLLVFAQRVGNINAEFIGSDQKKAKPLILKLLERFCF